MAKCIYFKSFADALAQGDCNLGGDSWKVALTSLSPSENDTIFANLFEIGDGNGYTAGGQAMPAFAASNLATRRTYTATPLVWTASGGSIGPFRYCVLYDATTGKLVCYWDCSGPVTVTAGGTFTINFDASAGSGRIQVVAPQGLGFSFVNSFAAALVAGDADYTVNNRFKVALCKTQPVVTNQSYGDLNIIAAGNGYAAGGEAIDMQLSGDGKPRIAAGNTITWTANSGAIGPFNSCALWVNDSFQSIVGWWNFGRNITIPNGMGFSIRFAYVANDFGNILQLEPSA